MSHGFLLLSLVSLTELCSFWYGVKELFTMHKLANKVFPTDDVTRVERTWIRMGGYRRFRDEWVKCGNRFRVFDTIR